MAKSLSTGAAQIIQQGLTIALQYFVPFGMFGATIDNFVAYSAIVSF